MLSRSATWPRWGVRNEATQHVLVTCGLLYLKRFTVGSFFICGVHWLLEKVAFVSLGRGIERLPTDRIGFIVDSFLGQGTPEIRPGGIIVTHATNAAGFCNPKCGGMESVRVGSCVDLAPSIFEAFDNKVKQRAWPNIATRLHRL